MRPILSVSRRTDIPAFYSRWFMQALREGRCRYPNPVSGKAVEVSLEGREWAGIVFWTRNPKPLLPHLDEIDRAFQGRVNWQVSLTGMPKLLEENKPPEVLVLSSLEALGRRYGRRAVVWRFDPILLTTMTDPEWVRRRFAELAPRIAESCETCVTSFADDYRKALRNLDSLERRSELRRLPMTDSLQRELLADLRDTAAKAGLSLELCCEDHLLDVPGIQKARCLDYGRLGVPEAAGRSSQPTRAECACHASRDIGSYDSCAHGCLYCYATQTPAAGRDFLRRYREEGGRMPADRQDEEYRDTVS